MIFVSVVERFILDLLLGGKMAGILWRIVEFGDKVYLLFSNANLRAWAALARYMF